MEIFLPEETVDRLDELESFINTVGDLLAETHGNIRPENDFDLEKLRSFIIIRDEEIPRAENFLNQDMFLIIPIKEEK